MLRRNQIGYFSFPLLMLLQTLFAFPAYSQVFGNEWIKSDQTYYKIPVGKTGIYAVPLNQLRSAGIPVGASGSIPENELQMFRRGIEQAIYINNDSLFFYGERNDGTLDSLMYSPYSAQPHKYYNLYSDTSAYFLTWKPGVSGKRMTIASPVSASVSQTYHYQESFLLFNNEYDPGYKYSSSTYMTPGDIGEGWMSSGIGTSISGNPVLSADNKFFQNFVAPGIDGNLEGVLIGRTGYPGGIIHNIDVVLSDGVNPSVSIPIAPFSYHDSRKFSIAVPSSLLTSNQLSVRFRNNGSPMWPSTISIAYIKLKYPQSLNMGGLMDQYFNVPSHSDPADIIITNAPSNGKIFDITNKNDITIINSTYSSGNLQAVLPVSVFEEKLYIASKNSYLSIPDFKIVDLSPFVNSASADFIVVSNNKIMTGAIEYAKYRASNAGGQFDTLVADVNKLYNLFSYGERTPLAVRRFMEFLSQKGNPKHLFIIGKSISIVSAFGGGTYYRKDPNFYINHPDPTIRREDLVPSYGIPCSDLLFSTGLKGKPDQVATIATGRLCAKSNAEVMNYLGKVQEHEGLGSALWRKNILHLSGGEDEDQVIAFRQIVDGFKAIAEDTIFGGKVVKTFSKKNSNTVSSDLIGSTAEEINKGLSYVTFFGHSSPGVSDLDIGYASVDFYGYRNKGKYPMLIYNGCSASQMFGRYSFSEDWIITPDRGAILTLGHTDAGYASEFKAYTTIFYDKSFRSRSMSGKSVGERHLQTISEFYDLYGSGVGSSSIASMQQMVLQGDPAIKIYSPVLPDYDISASKLSINSFDTKVVTAVSDSFALKIVVNNLGVDYGDTVNVTVKRTINGKVITYGPVAYPHIRYNDTLVFVIRSPDIATYGENLFEVSIDPDNSIGESDEMNNTATLQYFMPLSGVIALLPNEYSIVNKDSVNLIGQSTNLLIGSSVDFFIQIDTTILFNSAYERHNVISGGSIVKWNNFKLPLLKDSTVYYWRIRYNNINPGEDTLWGESSFIYIHDSPEGWSQSAFPQFYKDGLFQVQRNNSKKEWEFTQAVSSIYLKSVGASFVRNPPDFLYTSASSETIIQVNKASYEFRNMCGGNMLLAMAFDKNTAQPYLLYPNTSGGVNCGIPAREMINRFNRLDDSISAPGVGGQNQKNLLAYINNLPEGDYVVFINSANVPFSKLSSVLKNAFKTEFGATLIDSVQSGMPYMLVAQKGNAVPIYENYVKSLTGSQDYSGSLVGKNYNGYITSTLIGPSEEWGTLYRNFKSQEAPSIDKYNLQIIGVNIEGKSIDTLQVSQKDTLDLSTIAGLSNYPYIRLLASVKDSVKLTPAQLLKWQVIYSGVPEGIMNPEFIGLNSYKPLSKSEGDSIKICYAFENISNYNFKDSLLVKYTITNSNTGPVIRYSKVKPLKKDSLVTFCYSFKTDGLVGNNLLQAYVNPQLQKEQYYNNNIIESSFSVAKDKVNPVLDVVIDGNHIMDGDIVSPNPLITITLNDENLYQLRNNPDGIEIYLKGPNDQNPVLISNSSSAIISAKQIGGQNKNSFQLEYNPKNLPDGMYSLVVKAKDVSGNSSGVENYSISFEVINESSITNFYPYPNPFSTNTRFVFTLTGNEVPQDLKIQIMTITGKVVREITKAEIGPIRIGNNKSEYAWDGTDEFGDKLANGVYLYRVILKNGEDFKHRGTSADKAFKKGFGKLYILR